MARLSPRADAKAGVKAARTDMYRRLIMEAAEQVFAEHGFDDAKMQDIAQGAGIALGTLYSVFPGKTEVYDAIQELRGRALLDNVYRSIQGHADAMDAALRMHLREGLSWAERESLKTGEQAATWERGVTLAVSLLEAGIRSGLLHEDNPPGVLLKMMISAHQIQLRDWLVRGADLAEVDELIRRMQLHFRRAFVREGARDDKTQHAARGAVRQEKSHAS
jgi:AcrR family transcriptional regulator